MRGRVATAALALAVMAGVGAIAWALAVEAGRPYCPKTPAGMHTPPQCQAAQGGSENHYSWED